MSMLTMRLAARRRGWEWAYRLLVVLQSLWVLVPRWHWCRVLEAGRRYVVRRRLVVMWGWRRGRSWDLWVVESRDAWWADWWRGEELDGRFTLLGWLMTLVPVVGAAWAVFALLR